MRISLFFIALILFSIFTLVYFTNFFILINIILSLGTTLLIYESFHDIKKNY